MKRDKFITDFPVIRSFIHTLETHKYQEDKTAIDSILIFFRKFFDTEIVVTIHGDGSLAIRGYDLDQNREHHNFDTGSINPTPVQLNTMLQVFALEQDEPRFKVIFNEKEPRAKSWETTSTEFFADYQSALKRFLEAVKVSFNACNSINYLVLEDGNDTDLAEFTVLQQDDIFFQERHL